MFNLFNFHNDQDDLDSIMEQSIIEERLRQAKISFNVAIAVISISTIVNILGVSLLLSGKVSTGVATTTGGLASNIISIQLIKLTRNANNRLQENDNTNNKEQEN